MWTDNETVQDLLGFRVHADLIRSVVSDPSLLPVTIGVFADWGGGKTSLMKMLECSLQPEFWPEGSSERACCEKIACLYFNGWLFEGYDDAKSAILSSVLVALGEHKRLGPKVRTRCAALLKSVNWMRVASLGLRRVAVPVIAAYATGGASLVPSLAGTLSSLWSCRRDESASPPCPEDSNRTTEARDKESEVNWEELIRKDDSPSGLLDVRSFREQFGQMLLESNIGTLVVLIDDLDRCSPERIVENLEAIKLFLNVQNTAFVIGADPRIVRHAIAWKYKQHGDIVVGEEDNASSDRLVTDYLEKLIQYPYRLPRLSPAEIETYMALLFCQLHLSSETFDKILTTCEQQRTDNRYMVYGYAAVQDAMKTLCNAPTPTPLCKSLAFCASAAPLITEGLKGNPRQVKRFLNAFILRKKLAEAAKLTNVDEGVLVKLMILEYSQERQFRQLFDWQAAQDGYPKQVAELEKLLREPDGNPANEDGAKQIHAEWGASLVRRWIAMDPPLRDVDLRDYFWVARDRLQTTLSGLSMISPLVRRVLESLLTDNPATMNATTKSISELQEEERTILFTLLDQRIKQKPGERAGYEAYRFLVEKDVEGAAARFSQILFAIPPEVIPPGVGMNLRTLVESKQTAAPLLSPALKHLQESETKVGVAAKGGQHLQRRPSGK